MKFSTIEITFPVPVEAPDGFFHVLDTMVDMICKKYEADNPTRVMWPAGAGSKPIFSDHDAAFLGIKQRQPTGGREQGGNEQGSKIPKKGEEPTFDNSVYQISVSEREDFAGRNPKNPDGKKLAREAHIQWKSNRAIRKQKEIEAWLDEKITVCDACLQASCWQAEHMCATSEHAGIVQKTRRELIALGREHVGYMKTDEELQG